MKNFPVVLSNKKCCDCYTYVSPPMRPVPSYSFFILLSVYRVWNIKIKVSFYTGIKTI